MNTVETIKQRAMRLPMATPVIVAQFTMIAVQIKLRDANALYSEYKAAMGDSFPVIADHIIMLVMRSKIGG